MTDSEAHAAAVAVAALTAARRFESLRREGERLAAAGIEPGLLREAAYAAALFCGFPSGVASLQALAELEPTQAKPHEDIPETRKELRRRGVHLFRRVHGKNAKRQLEMLDMLHPDYADTVLSEAYGRVLARPFLTLGARELIGVAALAVLGLGPQLRAHLLGARNVGVEWAEIEQAVRQAAGLGGVDAAAALATVAELRARES